MATEPVRVQQVIKFGGDFELDLRAYELRRSGHALKLEPTPFGILSLLIEQRGELVTRQHIVDRIWGKGVFLDTDNSINGAIWKIRQVLHDDPENPQFIQTVTGKGYRFIAPVAELEGISQRIHVLQPPEHTDVEPARRAARIKLSSALALSVLVVLGLSLWLLLGVRHRNSRSAPIHSLAVLPLENLSGDPSQDYFADAMTDELITELAKVGTLRVTSRTTVTRYKHTNKSLPEIARELNVAGIVEGSVVRSGQRLRITAQLIHGPADQHLWAETYERDFGDVVKLQRDVAQAITQHVRAQLTPELRAQFRSGRPVNPEAYEAYLKGRYYLFNQPITMAEPLNRAKTYFEEATRKDPSFSLAYSGLANSYVFLVFLGQGEMSAENGFRSAKQAVRKALELDENNGEAYDVLGQLSWHADLDWKAADEAFNKAIALAPSFSCAHEDRALFLSFMGRRAEALAEVEKSKQIDPGPLSAMTELGVYFQLRDWEHLVEAGQREVASYPNEWAIHAYLGAGYEGTGKLLEAIAEYQKSVELSNSNPDPLASIGHAYAVMGRRTEAKKILHELEQKVKTGRASPYLPATVYAGLGQKDKAFELLEKAHQEKSLDVSWILKPDLRTESLRSDPRFQDLLRRAGLGG
jgi:TolB-like protein/DNA-binding winged helix-turn-helix (wHTH) protein